MVRRGSGGGNGSIPFSFFGKFVVGSGRARRESHRIHIRYYIIWFGSFSGMGFRERKELV